MGCDEYIPYFLREFFEEIESSIVNNINLDIKGAVDKLLSFCYSDSFIPYLFCEFNSLYPFRVIIMLFEFKEKFLSMKLLFPLFEELRNRKFDILDKIIKVGNENEMKNYFTHNKNSIDEFLKKMNDKDSFPNIKSINPDSSQYKSLTQLYVTIFMVVFNDDLMKYKNLGEEEYKKGFINGLNSIIKLEKDYFESISDNLYKLNTLYYNNNTYNMPNNFK